MQSLSSMNTYCDPDAHIKNLPEEIIVGIFTKLEPMRRFNIDTQKREVHRFDNVLACITALQNLCLTSKQLSRIAQPILYSSLILGYPGSVHHLRALIYLRTILAKPELAKHLKYVEDSIDAWVEWGEPYSPVQERYFSNEFSSHLMDVATQIWGTKVQFRPGILMERFSYQQLLALILIHAPNLNHLFLVFGEQPSLFYWLESVAPGYLAHGNPFSFQQFTNLEILCVSNKQQVISHKHKLYWGERLITNLQGLPKLRHYQHKEPCQEFTTLSIAKPLSFHGLEVLEFRDCRLALPQVAAIVHGCKRLKEFSCQWEGAICGREDFRLSDMLDALQAVQNTLVYLSLSDNKAARAGSPMRSPNLIGDLSSFGRMRSLHLGDYMIFDGLEANAPWTEVSPPHRLSLQLPPPLEVLSLSIDLTPIDDDCKLFWDLADDLSLLPFLRRVYIFHPHQPWLEYAEYRISEMMPKLVARFAALGVTIETRRDEAFYTSHDGYQCTPWEYGDYQSGGILDNSSEYMRTRGND